MKIKRQKAKGKGQKVGTFLFCERRVLHICLLIFAFCLLPSFAQAKEEIVVRVAAESVAHADRLTLGDIAEIQGADQVVVERLRALALGYAPYVGVVRELP